MNVYEQIILLIDDSEANNFLNERLIKKYYTSCSDVKIALNGQIGMDYIKGLGKFSDREKYPLPNIILLDINMPVMDGFEFLEEFEKIKNKFPDISIHMLTSSIVEYDKVRAEKLGVDGFLVKPLTKKTLESYKF